MFQLDASQTKVGLLQTGKQQPVKKALDFQIFMFCTYFKKNKILKAKRHVHVYM